MNAEVELLLSALKVGRAAAKQLQLYKLEDLPSEVREELKSVAEEQQLEWNELLPKLRDLG